MTKLYRIDSLSVTIGRGSDADIYFPDEDMISSRHVTVEKNKHEADELFMQGKNGGYINGRFVAMGEKIKIEYADEIRLPHVTVIWLQDEMIVLIGEGKLNSRLKEFDFDESTGDGNGNENGGMISYSPSPKTYISVDTSPVELEAPPEKRIEEPQGTLMTIGPAFTMSIPMMLGVLITFVGGRSQGANANSFMYMGLITAVSSATLGGIWAMVNLKNRTRSIELTEIRRRKAYEEYVKNAEMLINEKYVKNRNALNAMNPVIHEKLNERFRNTFIYSRKRKEKDYLDIRLGTGNIRYEAQVIIPRTRFSVVSDDLKMLPKMLKQKYEYLSDVPICINLNKLNTIGIISDDILMLKELVNLIVLSVATEHSPYDLKIGFFITNNDFQVVYDEFLLFIPHLLSDDEKALITKENIIEYINNRDSDNKDIVIITDSYEKIKSVANIIFNENLSAGEYTEKEAASCKVHYIVIANSFIALPDECDAIIQREKQFSGVIYINEPDYEKKRQELHFDRLLPEEYRQSICLLAGLSKYTKSCKTSIPKSVSFLSLEYEISDILKEWSNNSTVDEIKVPIGKDSENSIQYLDFHQKKDGPHGLICGMTGSGKSEMLQTIILGLALKYHPDEVAFLLIDYKGGGMAELFGKLPHLMGSISNLSGKLVSRAMISIRSENEQRQKIFNESGVNNIYDYTKLYKLGKVKKSLPHIFIVIDEFAELKKEMPEFMQEIISISRVGRSLGLHLILATQKPSGTIDENIRSNSRFAICLKVSDRLDSMEVIKTDEASYIKNPGRAFLKVGNNEIYKEFQGAYTMAPYIKNNKKKKGVYFLDDYGNKLEDKDYCSDNFENRESELSISIAAIEEAGNKEGLCNLDMLWKPPLQEIIVSKEDNKEINLLMYDDPRHQSTGTISTDILQHGHMLILGFIQSGKSTFLQNISCEIIKKFDSNDFNLYFIDFSSQKLMPFSKSNMCGGYFYDENDNDIEKLFLMLAEIMKERRKIFSGTTFRQSVREDLRQPAIILFIDGFSAFREHTDARFDEAILNILKNGEALGIYLIVTALGISTNEFPNRMFESIRTTFTLSLNDKFLYAQALKVSADQIIQISDYPGRGLCKLNDDVIEFQAYVPVETNDDYLLRAYCEELVEKTNRASTCRALAVPIIPRNPRVNDLIETIENKACNSEGIIRIPIGYEIKSGKVYILPLLKNRNVIISGQDAKECENVLLVIEKMCEKLGLLSYEEDSFDFKNRVVIYDDVKFVIGIYNDNFGFNEAAEFNKKIGNDPYVIHLGGALDRCKIADFSYIPYMKQSEIKKPNYGTVLRKSEDEFYGDVVIVKP